MHRWKRRTWLVECGCVCGVVRSVAVCVGEEKVTVERTYECVAQCLYRLGSAFNLRRLLCDRLGSALNVRRLLHDSLEVQ